MNFYEVNFDGLVGPTHNYAGLSSGNIASESHAKEVSNPKEAALQGLKKMKALKDKGFHQGLIPPQARPDIHTLRLLGFTGRTNKDLIEKAYKKAPYLLAACYSASSMWTANAATVSPSPDTQDGKVHFTPANLIAKFHRSIEPPTTALALKKIFNNEKYFVHHPPLPAAWHFGDEGAANHTRLCPHHEHEAIELFVYGRQAFDEKKPKPQKYPARQTLEACEAIARRHQVKKALFAQQNPQVIDQGVFHNDVISVGNESVFFFHEKAFLNTKEVLSSLQQQLPELQLIAVPEEKVPVPDAVESYLFNSQLLSQSDGNMILVVPEECRKNQKVWKYIQEDLLTSSSPIKEVLVFDVQQSMKNGGGPACLRLRVVLSEEELSAVNPSCLLSDALYEKLVQWVNKHYRDQLRPQDLADPSLMDESFAALDELTQILGLGALYPFQME